MTAPTYSICYHAPNAFLRQCGVVYITTDINTVSLEQANNFKRISNKILESLGNLVSSFRTTICPVNEGEKSSYIFSIYLGGNLGQEGGEYEVQALNDEQILNTAKGIIAKEIKENNESLFRSKNPGILVRLEVE
jgi:hypothetical protein